MTMSFNHICHSNLNGCTIDHWCYYSVGGDADFHPDWSCHLIGVKDLPKMAGNRS